MKTLSFGGSDATSASLMNKMRADALADTTGKRHVTLDHLEEACNDIISGKAFDMARKHNFDTKSFRRSRKKIVAEDVHAYVEMRERLDGPGSAWKGPKKGTIRHDLDMRNYLVALTVERYGPRPSKKTDPSNIVNQIVDRLPSTDRLDIMKALEAGKEATKDLNTLRQVFHLITGVDLRTIGKDESVAEILSRIPMGIPEPDVKTIQNLLRRLTNDNVLSEMGLIFRGGRIKMDYAPGTELVSPEELKLLSKLSKLPLNDGDKP